MDNPALEEFVEEVEEIIEDLEEGVLELEAQPKKRSLIDRIFRDMHTIKGGAGMVMETELAEYEHGEVHVSVILLSGGRLLFYQEVDHVSDLSLIDPSFV